MKRNPKIKVADIKPDGRTFVSLSDLRAEGFNYGAILRAAQNNDVEKCYFGRAMYANKRAIMSHLRPADKTESTKSSNSALKKLLAPMRDGKNENTVNSPVEAYAPPSAPSMDLTPLVSAITQLTVAVTAMGAGIKETNESVRETHQVIRELARKSSGEMAYLSGCLRLMDGIFHTLGIELSPAEREAIRNQLPPRRVVVGEVPSKTETARGH